MVAQVLEYPLAWLGQHRLILVSLALVQYYLVVLDCLLLIQLRLVWRPLLLVGQADYFLVQHLPRLNLMPLWLVLLLLLEKQSSSLPVVILECFPCLDTFLASKK